MRKKNERAQDAKAESLGSRTQAVQYHNRDPSNMTIANIFNPLYTAPLLQHNYTLTCSGAASFPTHSQHGCRIWMVPRHEGLCRSLKNTLALASLPPVHSPPISSSQRAHKSSSIKSFSAIASACDGAVFQMLETVIHITSS